MIRKLVILMLILPALILPAWALILEKQFNNYAFVMVTSLLFYFLIIRKEVSLPFYLFLTSIITLSLPKISGQPTLFYIILYFMKWGYFIAFFTLLMFKSRRLEKKVMTEEKFARQVDELFDSLLK